MLGINKDYVILWYIGLSTKYVTVYGEGGGDEGRRGVIAHNYIIAPGSAVGRTVQSSVLTGNFLTAYAL